VLRRLGGLQRVEEGKAIGSVANYRKQESLDSQVL
jgi:hypothetical protein